MPGTITFRPVEANLTHDTNWLGKMDPYCMFSMGGQRVKSSVCRHGGTRPHWGDTVSLTPTALTAGAPNVVRLEVFDKDRFRPDDHIAYTDIDLSEIERFGSVAKWYPLYHHRKPAGEILIEAAVQQQQVFVQPTTTYVQETVISSAPIDTVVGESYVVNNPISYTEGLPVTQNIGLTTAAPITTATYTTTTTTNNLANSYSSAPIVAPMTANTNATLHGVNPALASKVSTLGPSGGFPHGNRLLGDAINVGHAMRPGYVLGDTEANPTCQSNLDSNGGGFFNKPSRERRAEPYSHSMPGTYGIPHGMTIDRAGQVIPNVQMERPAPIGTVAHPGITGYVDGFNRKTGIESYGAGSLAQPGLTQSTYTTGLPTGQPGFYANANQSGYVQPSFTQPGLQGSLGSEFNNPTTF